MNSEDIQQFADENNLDVRKLQNSQFRLFNSIGERVLDIYIKTKKGKIIKNTVMNWANNRWGVAFNSDDLLKII